MVGPENGQELLLLNKNQEFASDRFGYYLTYFSLGLKRHILPDRKDVAAAEWEKFIGRSKDCTSSVSDTGKSKSGISALHGFSLLNFFSKRADKVN